MANSNNTDGLQGHDLREGLSSYSSSAAKLQNVLTSAIWVTSLIVVSNALVFAAMAVTFRTVNGFSPVQLALWGGNSGTLDLSGQWWRLLSYQFLHANLLHIAVNMWVMWNVGRLAERLLGSINLLFVYLAAGVLAGLASLVWNPELVSVGASGSIFGVLGALLAYVLRFRSEAPSSILRQWVPLLAFAAYNIFAGAYQPGVDNAAHVGGLIAGLCLGAIVAKPPALRRIFHFGPVVAALMFAGICALPTLWYLNAFNQRSSAREIFVRDHEWYAVGEVKNLRLWQSLGLQMASGAISADEAVKEFEQNIIPFWRESDARLGSELKHARPERDPFVPRIADFAKLRLRWANAIVTDLRNRNEQNENAVLTLAQQTALAQAAIDRLILRDEADNLPVPLSQSVFAIQIKNLIPAFRQRCFSAPATLKQWSQTDDDNDGPARRHSIGCRAQQLFLTGDYRALDADMKAHLHTLSDLPDGSSSLEGTWNGLDDLFNYSGVSIEEAMRRTSEWRKMVKGSIEPDLVEALIFRDWAYGARGTGFASSVSQQAMQVYLARSAMAAAGLHDLERAGANDPAWYVLSLAVSRDLSVPLDKRRAIFNTGVAKFPNYAPLYRQMLTSLMPRWDGSTQQVDAFIRSVAKTPMVYADLYRIYGNLEGNDYSVIESQDPDPELLRQGMQQLIERHPRSDYILNSVARMACAGHEYAFYKRIRSKLDGHVSAAAWPDKLSVASCNKWNS